MTRFTLADIEKLGLKDNGDGTFSKQSLVKRKKTSNSCKYSLNNQTLLDVFKHAEDNNYIFVPHNVPSSKNSKRAFNGIVLESELCVNYRKHTDSYWSMFKDKFHKMIVGKNKPYAIEFFFVRGNRHRADFHNLVQLPCDIMQEYGWIDGDDMDEMVPVPVIPKTYSYDKKLPGLIIKVL